MRINPGKFEGDKYIKSVTFSKAVLWYKRQLSLRISIIDEIKRKRIKKIIFIDKLKGEKWIFSTRKVFGTMKLTTVGQETQYYFPIDICKKELLTKEKPKQSVKQASLL